MKIKIYLNVFFIMLMLGLPNFSWALDVKDGPSSFLSTALARIIQIFPKDKTYDELKQQLWQEYLAYSENYAKKFFEAAEEKNVSLKNYMCATVRPSESARKIQNFQSKTVSDLGLKEGRDQAEVIKLQELQSAYKEICRGGGADLELNERASLVIAETTFYLIYNSCRIQLAELFMQK